MPRAAATAVTTLASSTVGNSSTNHTSPVPAWRPPATSRARRVLPEPPAPLSVTAREVVSSSVISRSSDVRPMKRVRAAGRCRAAWGPSRDRSWVLMRALELSQLGSGVEPDLAERGPRPLQGSQRLGLATVAVEGEGQEPPAPLAQRFVDRHRLELGDHLVMAAGGQLGVAVVFLDAPVQLGQAGRLDLTRRPLLQLRQRIASPRVERRGEGRDRRRGVAGAQELAPGSGVVFEAAGVGAHAVRPPAGSRPTRSRSLPRPGCAGASARGSGGPSLTTVVGSRPRPRRRCRSTLTIRPADMARAASTVRSRGPVTSSRPSAVCHLEGTEDADLR